MNNLILTAVLIAAFVAVVTAYSMGVRHGLMSARGIVPKTPLKAVTDAVGAVKDTVVPPKPSEIDEVMETIMEYSFENALKGVKQMREGGGS